MNILRNQAFDSTEYTDVNFLYGNQLVDIPTISKNMTYIHGKDSNMFPLTYTTEGQDALSSVKSKKLNDTQYTWDIMGRLRLTSKVVGVVGTVTDNVGVGHSPFEVEFEDGWFIKDYGATTPDGDHQVRIQGKGSRPNSYIMVITSGDIDEGIEASNFAAGKSWVMGAPAVAVSKSDGNRTNRQTPGKLTNQYGLYRYSMNIAGNIANKATVYQFELEGGGTTDMWIPEEMRQFDFNRRVFNESELWYSKYNRDAFGNVTTVDDTTGEVVPKGAGIKEMITEAGNHSTYTTLTLDKLESTINRIFSNYLGEQEPEIVLYTGAGGLREFNRAITNDATAKSYYDKLGWEEVQSMGNYMEYGKYFKSYRTIEDKVLTVVNTSLFNNGPRAQMDIANGRTVNGFPIESYNMVYLDHSQDDSGERNIQMVVEEGREYIANIYKGMANLPSMWGAVSGNLISTRKDIASYEVMESKGINMRNATTSFWLEKDFVG